MVGFMGLIFLVCCSANKGAKRAKSTFMFYSIYTTLSLRVLLSSENFLISAPWEHTLIFVDEIPLQPEPLLL